MGKTIIIPDADFSLVAVDKIEGEPTEFIPIVGYKLASASEDGDYFISGDMGKVAIKDSDEDSGYMFPTLPSGTYLKYLGFYFKVPETTPPYYKPYYNSVIIGFDQFEDGGFVFEEGTITPNSTQTFVNNYVRKSFAIPSGSTIIFNNYGGQTTKALVVDYQNGTIEAIDGSTSQTNPYEIRKFTNNTDSAVIAYMNYPRARLDYMFLAMSNGK